YWIEERRRWYLRFGIRESHLRVRAHEVDELSHYSSATSDIEYLFPMGWSELEGIANRGDYDLRAHTAGSGTRLEGVGSGCGDSETHHPVLRLHPEIAPVKVAVLPLIPRNAEIAGRARALYEELRRAVVAEYDDSG